MFWRKDFEALYRAYGHFVSVEIDTASGVSTLAVKATGRRTRSCSRDALLSYSEQLINELNERARRDALGTVPARGRQHRAADRADPGRADRLSRSSRRCSIRRARRPAPLELVGADERGSRPTRRAQLGEVLKNSPNSPQIPLVRTRIASLDKLIAEERAKVTRRHQFGGRRARANTSGSTLQRQLAEKALASAFTSLEAARLEAQRQQLYLETIAQPNLADYPLYPKRIVSFVMVVVTCLLPTASPGCSLPGCASTARHSRAGRLARLGADCRSRRRHVAAVCRRRRARLQREKGRGTDRGGRFVRAQRRDCATESDPLPAIPRAAPRRIAISGILTALSGSFEAREREC